VLKVSHPYITWLLDDRLELTYSPDLICGICGEKPRKHCPSVLCKNCKVCKKPPTELQQRGPEGPNEFEGCSFCDVSLAYCKEVSCISSRCMPVADFLQSQKDPGACEQEFCPTSLCSNCPACGIAKAEGESPIVEAHDAAPPQFCHQCEGFVYHCRVSRTISSNL
jgi:hypothetical protein